MEDKIYYVPPKQEIEFKGVWYRAGDFLPRDYKPPVKKSEAQAVKSDKKKKINHIS